MWFGNSLNPIPDIRMDTIRELERILSRQTLTEFPKQTTIEYPFRFPKLFPNPLLYLMRSMFKDFEIEMKPNMSVLSDFLDELQGKYETQNNLFIDALENAKKVLVNSGIDVSEIVVEFSYYEDPEIEDLRRLFVSFKIKSESFSELQTLWDKIIDEFYKELPLPVADNIIVEVEPRD